MENPSETSPTVEHIRPEPTRRWISVIPNLISLKTAREYIVTLSFYLALALAGVVIYGTLSDRAIRISPIKVPADLAARGYTTELLPKRIADEIHLIQTHASTIKERAELGPDRPDINIQIPGSEVSVTYLAEQLGTFLGLEKREIGGEVTKTDQGYAMRIRLPDGGAFIDVQTVSANSDAIEDLIKRAAQETLGAIDPFMMASYHFAAGDYEKAKAYVGSASARTSRLDRAWALNLMGVIDACNFEQSPANGCTINFVRALGHVNRAIELEPNFALPYLNKANIYGVMGHFEQAKLIYETAAKLYPALPNLHRNWALLLSTRRHFNDAIAVLQAGLAARPGDTAIAHLLAEYLIRRQRFPDAIAVLLKLKSRDPTDAVTRYLLSAAYANSLEGRALAQPEREAAEYLDPSEKLKPDILR
jgi:Flp pilus assembly protein TadD